MKTTRRASSHAKHYPPGSFIGKLRRRRIPETLAAFLGGGWLVYEIVHWILVDHYHFPEKLIDITIVSVLCAMFCTLTLRWFRGEKEKRRIKWELVLIPLFLLITAVFDVHLLLHLEANVSGRENANSREIIWKNSVAVLPFVDMSPEKNQEYFSDGLTEELINDLSKIRELRVAGRTSSFQFKGRNEDLRLIGQKLNVAAVLEGSVRKEGDRVRITAQLINAEDGFHLWSETYDRELAGIFAVQEDLARSVAQALKVTLFGDKKASAQTENTEAYNAFLLGQYFYGQQTREDLEKAVSYFEQAVKLDSTYAGAWVGLGSTYAYQAGLGYIPPEDGYAQARAAVERALVQDENLAYAYAVKGWIQMSHDWDWTGADASFHKALSLEPGRGLLEAAQLAVALGRSKQALDFARRAVQRDPISAQALTTLALAAWYGGRLDEAVAAYRKILELIPEYPAIHGLLGLIHLTRSNLREALAELEQAKDPYWRLPGLAMVYHSLGKKMEADAVLAAFIEKYQDGAAYNIAQVYAFRGEADLAFQWLDKAYAQHDGGLFLVKVDPFLKNLKRDPRYAAFLKKMRLSG